MIKIKILYIILLFIIFNLEISYAQKKDTVHISKEVYDAIINKINTTEHLINKYNNSTKKNKPAVEPDNLKDKTMILYRQNRELKNILVSKLKLINELESKLKKEKESRAKLKKKSEDDRQKYLTEIKNLKNRLKSIEKKKGTLVSSQINRMELAKLKSLNNKFVKEIETLEEELSQSREVNSKYKELESKYKKLQKDNLILSGELKRILVILKSLRDLEYE